jgi:hypothetical protein
MLQFYYISEHINICSICLLKSKLQGKIMHSHIRKVVVSYISRGTAVTVDKNFRTFRQKSTQHNTAQPTTVMNRFGTGNVQMYNKNLINPDKPDS